MNENTPGPTYQGPSETTYCAGVKTFSDSVTVTGTANYVARLPYGGSSTGGLGSADPAYTNLLDVDHGLAKRPAVNPIRYAEIRVTDAAGNVIQCGETLHDGTFSVQLPKGNVDYTLSVTSRANNSHVKVSVLNKTDLNQFYSLSSSVNASANVTGLNLKAAADGDVLGGAFNIMDQILNANEFLRAKVGDCSTAVDSDCPNFSVASKVTAYWTKGFNPNSYFGNSSGLSFYLPGYSRLFILGGIDGDVDSSDTDHFDNSVIIHEYGHFLEDTEFKSDSPGGSHNGNRIIDPRLAWSEGWGNFFQAAVQDYDVSQKGYLVFGSDTSYSPRYIDTIGNIDGNTYGYAYFADLETASSGNDLPNAQGEGNFREFAVTRLLWDVIDAAADGSDNVSNEFSSIWTVLKRTSGGFRDGAVAFRNVGYLHLAQQALQTNFDGSGPVSDWAGVRSENKHDGDESHYAQYVVKSAGTCSGGSMPYSITPVSQVDTSYSGSDLFNNNRFYHFKITSGGTYTITLTYQSTGTEADLDLYLYNKSARFATSNDVIKYSIDDPDHDNSTPETESITVGLSAGDYLIDINAYVGTAVGSLTNFSLTLNGSNLCQGNIVPL